ncbi:MULTISPECIES: hypothetical protein [unclassified Streptomyces]|uniref:hypothetical protein n=1 Tax=unclassified Streptomyces TaxID=2593676 RepID=UPI00081B7B46|nr:MULTISPECIES: hypothetical protein [unclassified Streptomyces]SCE55153.1 hypothetical protein GA0115234_111244 [Streptomyces sp. DvalAA-43]
MNPTTSANPTDPTAPSAPDAEEISTEKIATEKTAFDTGKADSKGTDGADDRADDGAGEALAETEDLDPDDFDDPAKEPSGLGAAASAVAAAALGVVALTGSWTGKFAAERETLIGQIKTSSNSTAAQQISEIYGDAWHSTALVNGLFALLALLAGVFALVRPAFGAPSAHPQPGWVRAVATAGIALGVLGLVISIGMYFDLIVPLPTAGAAQ